MTSGATVTAAEIARIAGVRPAAVSNWRRRYSEFPTPVGGTAASPQFSLPEVVEWLRAHKRSVRLSPADEVWRAMEAVRDPSRPAGILAAVGRHLLGEEPPADRTQTGTRGTSPPEETVCKLPQELSLRVAELGRRMGATEAFEALLDRWVEAHARQVEVTPAPVASLMCALAGPAEGSFPPSVLDPACGTGGLLLAAAGSGTALCLGQEADADLALVSAARLRLHGHSEVSVAAGDSLLADAHLAAKARGVVCNLPFGQRDWGRAQLGYDTRWTYGLPPNGEPELAWVQHALAHLDHDGRAALLMPAAAAVRPSGRRIRAELVRRGALRAVIALPSGSATTHSLGTHLWLAQAGEGLDANDLLFVDAELVPGRTPRSGTPETDWRAVSRAVTSAWWAFQAGIAPDSSVSSVVPIAELLDEEVDLTPARHVRTGPDDVVDLGQLDEERTRWPKTVAGLANALPAVHEVPAPTAPEGALVSLDNLIATGALLMWRGSSGREPGDTSLIRVRVLGLNDGLSRTPPSREGYASEAERISEGDVLVFAGVPHGARPAESYEYGAAPGLGVTVLRPKRGVVDSWFLAGAMTGGPGNGRLGATSGTSGRPSRLDPGRLFLPVRGLEDQRRIGRAFRDIAMFDASLQQAVEHGRSLARRLTDALAAGLVEPIDDGGKG